MVASVLALSLLGLSAVNALPAQPVEERQTWTIGPGEGNFGGGLSECAPGVPEKQQLPCLLPPITGGFKPPGGALPKERRDEAKETLKLLQLDLIELQNKKDKTPADHYRIKSLQAAIKHLAGIVAISAPEGSSTTFTPGKRDSVTFEPIGAFASQCPDDLEGYRKALQRLQAIPNPTLNDALNIKRLFHILAGCGFSISDGDATLIRLSDVGSEEVIKSLENAYTTGLQRLDGSAPSFDTWLVFQGIADQLELAGVSVDRSVGFGSAPLAKRQGSWKLGCQGADLIATITVWNALVHDFGRDPRKWPVDIFWQYFSTLQTLQLCGIIVGELIPNPTVPGGPIVPDPTVPGGPLRPDPAQPGGPLQPDPANPGSPLKPDPVTPGGAIVPDPAVPGGAMKPDPAVPGGAMKPDPAVPGSPPATEPYVPGGALTPDPTTPGGALKPPKAKRSGPNTATLEALQILDKYYGPPKNSNKGGSIIDIGDKGVIVIGWPTTRFGISP